MKLLLCVSLLSYLVSALPTVRQSEPTKGSITEPSAGAVIMPGTPFDFQYTTRADYSCTSFNFTILLLTSLPSSFGPTDLFSTGHFFGRFAEPNYPGNPNPPNPVPSQLVMPDFSKSPGGWGAGIPASNMTMYIVVLEEFADGVIIRPDPNLRAKPRFQASVGIKLSLAVTPIVYNRTAV